MSDGWSTDTTFCTNSRGARATSHNSGDIWAVLRKTPFCVAADLIRSLCPRPSFRPRAGWSGPDHSSPGEACHPPQQTAPLLLQQLLPALTFLFLSIIFFKKANNPPWGGLEHSPPVNPRGWPQNTTLGVASFALYQQILTSYLFPHSDTGRWLSVPWKYCRCSNSFCGSA